MSLTVDAINKMARGETDCEKEMPIVQILELTPLSKSKRYKVVISDGVNKIRVITSESVGTDYVKRNRIRVNTLIRLEDVLFGEIDGHRIILMIGIKVIDNTMSKTIGDPIFIK